VCCESCYRVCARVWCFSIGVFTPPPVAASMRHLCSRVCESVLLVLLLLLTRVHAVYYGPVRLAAVLQIHESVLGRDADFGHAQEAEASGAGGQHTHEVRACTDRWACMLPAPSLPSSRQDPPLARCWCFLCGPRWPLAAHTHKHARTHTHYLSLSLTHTHARTRADAESKSTRPLRAAG
jgi:hypothetical protein